MANHDQNSLKRTPVIVIMVPFPAQSHLNQLLQLSSLISSYNIPVHYVTSAIHNRQVKLRRHGINPTDITQIQFHDFPIPTFLSPPPNPNASIKFPTHLQSSFEACLHLRQPVAGLLHAFSPTADKIIIIHDSLMASVVQDAASIPNAETYAFHCISAFTSFFNRWEAMGRPITIETEVPELPSREDCFTFEIMNFIAYQAGFKKFKAGHLRNTCRLIEGTYIKLLEQLDGNQKCWAIGPLHPVTICEHRNSNRQDKCFKWLDKQAPNSVLYISFGTTTSLADEQIKELAIGLEQSETKFIWVLRDADRGDVFTEVRRAVLPEGFEERMEGVGMVVRDWAPQLEILGHPSTGGFVSHCGWNSCMESISMGVPIAAWPMHSDQPSNAVLVTEMLKIGRVVNKWTHREEIVTSSTIKEVVRRLMTSEEGEEMRKRAEELGEAVRQSATEGGVSRKELESFIAHISR